MNLRNIFLSLSILPFIGFIFTFINRDLLHDLYFVFLWITFLFLWLPNITRIKDRLVLSSIVSAIGILALAETAVFIGQVAGNADRWQDIQRYSSAIFGDSETSGTEVAGNLDVSISKADLDRVYHQQFMSKTFYADGVRAYHLPPNFSSRYVNTDEYGFRNAPGHPKQADIYRIGIFGGSTAYGSQALSDNDTIAFQLETALNDSQQDRTVEVLNFAVPAGNSMADISTFAVYGPLYQLDMALFYTGGNDLGGSVKNMLKISQFASVFLNTSQDASFLYRMFTSVVTGTAKKILDRLYSVNTTLEFLGVERDKTHQWLNQPSSTTDGEQALSTYLANMEKIYKIGQALGIKVVVVHQVNHVQAVYSRGLDNVGSELELYKNLKVLNEPWTEYAYRNFEQKVLNPSVELAQKYDINYHSVFSTFDNIEGVLANKESVSESYDSGPVFISNGHYTRYGTVLISRELAKIVIAESDQI